MTFLELCQAVRQDCGIQGSGPVTVVAQTGLTKRIIDWTAQATLDIENLHPDWAFLWRVFSMSLVLDATLINNGTDIGRWDLESFAADKGTDDGFRMMSIGYRDTYDLVSDVSTTTPYLFYVKPDNTVQAVYPSDDTYAITADYWIRPAVMTANTDEPLFAQRYHRAIVERAKMFFYQDEEVIQLYQVAEKEYTGIVRTMERDYLNSGISLGLNAGPEMAVRPV